MSGVHALTTLPMNFPPSIYQLNNDFRAISSMRGKALAAGSDPGWRPFRFNAGQWRNLGAPWQGCQYRKINNMVIFRGVMVANVAVPSTTLGSVHDASIGELYDPTHNMVFQVIGNNNVSVQVTVSNVGVLTIPAAFNDFISLNGIVYTCNETE